MISIDENGWINPTCPYCECVMEFNYHAWLKLSSKFPDLNLYCRRCHYAVKIEPATTDYSEHYIERTFTKVTRYNRSGFDEEEEE
jgi:hypothetical protein